MHNILYAYLTSDFSLILWILTYILSIFIYPKYLHTYYKLMYILYIHAWDKVFWPLTAMSNFVV